MELKSQEISNIKSNNLNIQCPNEVEIRKHSYQTTIKNFRQKVEPKDTFINIERNTLNSNVEHQNQKNQIKSIQNQDMIKDNLVIYPLCTPVFNIEKDLLNMSQSQQQMNRDSQFQLFDKRDQQKKDIKNDNLSKNVQDTKPNLFVSKLQTESKYQSEKLEFSEYGILDSSSIQQAKRQSIKKGIEFLVIKNIKKFISNIKKKSRRLLFKALSKPQFLLINDVSSNYDYYFEKGYFNLSVYIYLAL
ncbi:cyclic nucleotide-binding domain protein, putative (macronuclear) [Tetrahymena thermophila SB210]|uniref:Cyclic nucleotide-binding domain protein, putative n=1 Tax=Tetrahymena thermophila (strain SB210) TaxID=312017 RepID=Q22U42_TETTS|nr:cyclic nucleotide-binding domain protein, putative [Tetrahymena thermophila SB210]EAR88845.1 cyclic nucleotide-binding domain protein, putative [Tetrahymena thermophila SB210]|eukprot:XP_001009090.1 cyclic nucleotide-binding domain protein, putative [Tetrahymena thermophila SB210]